MTPIENKTIVMNHVRQIHGGQLKDLITRFFYKDNHLCFQIQLYVEGGEVIAYKEFDDYTEYKRAFSHLQEVRASGGFLKLPEINFKKQAAFSKVAWFSESIETIYKIKLGYRYAFSSRLSAIFPKDFHLVSLQPYSGHSTKEIF